MDGYGQISLLRHSLLTPLSPLLAGKRWPHPPFLETAL
ncbi:Uncharacterised protein [Vibrio cholerae]|nr:Uncharacterised protein [Vibrio cholerae]CSI35862.1 Uncharacterised protein [Vibrio cholerae]